MNHLLQRFFAICLLRAGPQDLPASRFLMVLCLGIYGGAGFLLSLGSLPWLGSLVLILVDTLLLVLISFLLLWMRALTERFTQVCTALAGTGIFFELLALPLLIWQQHSVGAFQQDGGNGLGIFISALVLWLCLFWNLIVIGHILRHALSTLMPVGLALGVAYLFISISISRQLTAFFVASG